MMKAIDGAEPFMPKDKPRYLMGVGLPEDIVGAVGRGIDMFDCVIPTRYGRSGTCFTRRGRIRLEDRRYRNDLFPIDPSCACYACQNFSRSYLAHCIKTEEILGTMMCTYHNVYFYHQLMKEIRQAIEEKRYAAFCTQFEAEYLAGDRERRNEHLDRLFDTFAVGAAATLPSEKRPVIADPLPVAPREERGPKDRPRGGRR
jgi:queuine tRNA-ribosyltransferase